MNIRTVGHLLFRCNFVKTIWFNFKMLPFKQAKKLPVYIYRNVHFRDLTGEIIINNVFSGMIRIGRNTSYVSTSIPFTEWTIRGKIVFNGSTHFLQGSYVLVSDNATLSFGRGWCTCGTNIKIICFNRISIGNRVGFAWDCQVMDTSFHYIQEADTDIENANINPLTKEVVIGDHVWIGNRTTISRGTVLPDDSIVASNSLVNKDYSSEGSFCMFAGMPAKVVKRNIKRIWNEREESDIDKRLNYFRTHL